MNDNERQFEDFVNNIKFDDTPDSDHRNKLEQDLIRVIAKQPRHKQQPLKIWRIIMKSKIAKLAAAAVIIVAVMLTITFFDRGTTPAYAFEQTVAAMQGKCSFHIQTYWGTPTQRKDEFWAVFDEHGKVIRCRQLEWWGQDGSPIEVLWENRIKHQYEPFEEEGPGILVISTTEHHVDESKLEQCDPEWIMERIYNQIDDGEATIEVGDSPTQDGYIVVEVTEHRSQWLRVLLVDPETDLVVRMDTYEPYEPEDPDDEDYDDESLVVGDFKYIYGIEVLEYNQPFNPKLFQPNFPEDTIVIDHLSSREVGMAQGDLSDEEVAYEVLRQALEAWAADDYDTAGMLFGGAPREFFMHRTFNKPIDDIVIGELESAVIESGRLRFKSKCRYVAEREGQLITTNEYYFVTTVAGQPDRWFVTPIKL